MSKSKKSKPNNETRTSWTNCDATYSFIKDLGEGGNAIVKLVENTTTKENFALKGLLPGKGKVRQDRFLDEIKVMLANSDVKGILPIVDFNPDEFWYVMPIAESILEHIQNAPDRMDEIKIALGQLSDTLIILHKRKVAHRDIKPDNLYFYDGRYCFGDFGIADFPDHQAGLTNTTKNLGAKFTIAPEMMRTPKEADYLKADVYSMAKTCWMLLSGDMLGFEGSYNYHDPKIGLQYCSDLDGKHLAELERLLYAATSNDPDCRPNIVEFHNELINWIRISNDVDISQESDWEFISELIFGRIGVPQTAVWVKTEDIVNVLKIVVKSVPAYNHVFLPGSGGADLTDVNLSASEVGWVDFEFEYITSRVKPKKLIFESFEDDTSWNYFRLELCDGQPVLHDKDYPAPDEMLVEVSPGLYVDSTGWSYGPNDKVIQRYYRGVFLITLKYGRYNAIKAVYDGRHCDCDSKMFRKYTEHLIRSAYAAEKLGLNVEQYLNLKEVAKNPFRD